MNLPVHYNSKRESGWGEILNIGSNGALFTIHQPLVKGQLVYLCIGWPMMLNEKVHLNLVAAGVVVRVEGNQAAVRFEKRSFRTSSSAFFKQAVQPKFRETSSQQAAVATATSQG